MAEKLEIEIGADVSGLKSGLNQARDDIKGFKERAKSDTAIELSVKVAELKAQLQNIKQLLKQEIPPEVAIQLSAKAELLQRDITQAGRELTNFLRTGQKDVSVLGNLFTNLWQGMRQAFSGDISGAVSSFKSGISGIGTAAIGAMAGLALFSTVAWFIKSATSEAFEFQKSLLNTQVVTGSTKKEMSALGDTIKEISNQTGIASKDLAETAFFVASAGVAMKDIPTVLDTISKASVATGTDSKVLFQGLSSVASTYGIDLQNVKQISDLFFEANKDGKLTIEGLSASIGTVAPIANTAGVSLKELTAGFATMVGTTGNADEVATQLKGAIQAIAAPSAEATVKARELGIELGEQAIKGKGLAGVIKDIYDKTGGHLEAIKTIIPEVRALTAVTYLWSQGNELYAQNLDKLNNSLGQTDKAFSTYTDDQVADIQKAQAKWDNWKISIGESFNYFFAVLINSATYLNKWIQLGVAIVGEFVLAFGTGFVLVGESLGNFIGFMITNFSKMGGNLKIIAENIGYNIGTAFDNVPKLIATALQNATSKVFDFFSSAINKYNEFVKFIGQDNLAITSKISTGGVTGGGDGPKFRDVMQGTEKLDTSFNFSMTKKGVDAMGRGLADIQGKWADLTTTVKENAVATQNNIGASTNNTKAQEQAGKTLDGLNAKLTDLKTKLGKTDIGSKAFKDLQKEIVSTQNEIDNLNDWTKKPKKWPSATSIASKELKEQKKAIENTANAQIKAVNESTASELDKATKIVAINKKLKDDLALIDGNYADVQARHAEEAIKNDKEQMDKLKKIKQDAYKDLTDEEKKNVDDVKKLGNAYADLKQKLADVGKKWAEDIKQINDEIDKLKKNLADITTKGQQDIATRGIEAAKELKDLQDKKNTGEGMTAEDLQKMLDLQKEIDLVNSNTTPEERAKALVESQKSQAQLLIDALKLKQEEATKDIATAEAKKKATEDQLALDKKAIQDKMDAIAIQITTETQLMIDEDVKRRKLEADYTAFFGEQMAQRKATMQELINMAREAQIALQSAGVSTMSGTAVASSNSTANSVVQNITNNSNVDAESFLRALNNKLPTK